MRCVRGFAPIHPTVRVFIALEVPSAVKEVLQQQQVTLQQNLPAQTITWVKTDGIHITLKFLGDVPRTQIDPISHQLSQVVQNQSVLSLEAVGVGCFPNYQQPKVIWAGLAGARAELMALRNAVEAQISPFGYPTENRPYTPHLTLGRVKTQRKNELTQIGQHLKASQGGHLAHWVGQTVQLMQSELMPSGAVYTPLASFELSYP